MQALNNNVNKRLHPFSITNFYHIGKMASPRKFVLAESEAFTIKMMQELMDGTTFIRSISEESQAKVLQGYATSIDHIKNHGSEHPITLDHVRDLCEDLISIRHFTNAATILDRACLGCKRCYGSDHVNVTLVLSRQAYALSSDRKFEASVHCYMKSLRLLEMLFNFQLDFSQYSSDHHIERDLVVIPAIAVPVVDGLGYTLGALQRHAESEFYFRILLHYYICGTVYDTNNISTDADSSKDTNLLTNNRFISPEPLGKQNAEALKAVNKLAKALQAQGKYVQADSLCMDSLDDCILSLGPNHPTTQTSVVTVAQLKHAQGKLQQAEEMYRRSLACNEEVLGVTHVETLSNVVLIAGIRAELHDYRGAQTLYNRARMGYETAIGPLHSSTIDTVHCIGEMLLLQQKPTAALELLHKAYEERLAYYGALHPATLATLFCIGKGYHLESLWKHRPDYKQLVEKAVETLVDTIAGFDTVLGVDSVQSIECCDYLSGVLLEINRFNVALPYSRRVYDYCNTGTCSTAFPSSKTTAASPLKSPIPLSKQTNKTSLNPATPSKSTTASATTSKSSTDLQYGPMHRRTAEAAYRLATLLENSTSISSAEERSKHIEAADLFLQTHEAYSRMLNALLTSAPPKHKVTFSRENSLNNKDNDSSDDSELTESELNDLIGDAMEQHQHALRTSLY